MDYGLIGGIAKGLDSGLKAYQDAVARREKREADAEARKFQQEQFNAELQMKGYQKDPETGKYVRTDESKQKEREESFGGLIKQAGDDAPFLPAYGKRAQGLITGETPDYQPSDFQYPAGYKDKKARDMLGEWSQREDMKESREERKFQRTAKVPGYELGAEYRPQGPEIQKFRMQTSTVKNLNRLVGELDDLVAKHGTENAPTAAKRLMQSKLAELKIAGKEYANLGVLNGPDMGLLLEQLGDPTEFTLNPWAASNVRKTLKSVKDSAAKGLELQAKATGYQPSAPPLDLKDPKVQQAKAAGYSDDEIRAYLNGQK